MTVLEEVVTEPATPTDTTPTTTGPDGVQEIPMTIVILGGLGLAVVVIS